MENPRAVKTEVELADNECDQFAVSNVLKKEVLIGVTPETKDDGIVFGSDEDGRRSLIGVSNQYGLVAIGTKNEIVIVKTSSIHKFYNVETRQRHSMSDDILCRISLPTTATCLSFSHDDLFLAICFGNTILIYHASQLSGVNPKELCAHNTNGTILRFCWKPAISSVLFFVITDAQLCEIGRPSVSDKKVVLSKTLNGVSTASWNPTGNYIIIGRRGEFSFMCCEGKKKMDVFLEIGNNKFRVSENPITYIHWFEENTIFFVEKGEKEVAGIATIDRDKTKIADISVYRSNILCIRNDEAQSRKETIFSFYILQWKLLLIYYSFADKPDLITQIDNNWSSIFSDKAHFMESIPRSNTNACLFPIGVSMDYTYDKEMSTNAAIDHSPLPVALVFTTNGTIQPFAIMDSSDRTQFPIIKPVAQIPGIPGQTPKSTKQMESVFQGSNSTPSTPQSPIGKIPVETIHSSLKKQMDQKKLPQETLILELPSSEQKISFFTASQQDGWKLPQKTASQLDRHSQDFGIKHEEAKLQQSLPSIQKEKIERQQDLQPFSNNSATKKLLQLIHEQISQVEKREMELRNFLEQYKIDYIRSIRSLQQLNKITEDHKENVYQLQIIQHKIAQFQSMKIEIDSKNESLHSKNVKLKQKGLASNILSTKESIKAKYNAVREKSKIVMDQLLQTTKQPGSLSTNGSFNQILETAKCNNNTARHLHGGLINLNSLFSHLADKEPRQNPLQSAKTTLPYMKPLDRNELHQMLLKQKPTKNVKPINPIFIQEDIVPAILKERKPKETETQHTIEHLPAKEIHFPSSAQQQVQEVVKPEERPPQLDKTGEQIDTSRSGSSAVLDSNFSIPPSYTFSKDSQPSIDNVFSNDTKSTSVPGLVFGGINEDSANKDENTIAEPKEHSLFNSRSQSFGNEKKESKEEISFKFGSNDNLFNQSIVIPPQSQTFSNQPTGSFDLPIQSIDKPRIQPSSEQFPISFNNANVDTVSNTKNEFPNQNIPPTSQFPSNIISSNFDLGNSSEHTPMPTFSNNPFPDAGARDPFEVKNEQISNDTNQSSVFSDIGKDYQFSGFSDTVPTQQGSSWFDSSNVAFTSQLGGNSGSVFANSSFMQGIMSQAPSSGAFETSFLNSANAVPFATSSGFGQTNSVLGSGNQVSASHIAQQSSGFEAFAQNSAANSFMSPLDNNANSSNSFGNQSVFPNANNNYTWNSFR